MMSIAGLASASFYSTASARYNRPARGLYANRGLLFGNTISEFGNKNRRTWKPNIQHCSLYSELLAEKVPCRVSTQALKQIDWAGGLDNYILNQIIPESDFAAKLKSRLVDKQLQRELQTTSQ